MDYLPEQEKEVFWSGEISSDSPHASHDGSIEKLFGSSHKRGRCGRQRKQQSTKQTPFRTGGRDEQQTRTGEEEERGRKGMVKIVSMGYEFL